MAQKIESSLKNMVISLFVIALFSGLSLGFVQQITKEPIAQSHLQKQIDAISAVVPAFNNNPLETCEKVAVDDDSLAVYTAQNGDEIVGYAILSSTNSGFGGNMAERRKTDFFGTEIIGYFL